MLQKEQYIAVLRSIHQQFLPSLCHWTTENFTQRADNKVAYQQRDRAAIQMWNGGGVPMTPKNLATWGRYIFSFRRHRKIPLSTRKCKFIKAATDQEPQHLFFFVLFFCKKLKCKDGPRNLSVDFPCFSFPCGSLHRSYFEDRSHLLLIEMCVVSQVYPSELKANPRGRENARNALFLVSSVSE